MNFFLVKKAKMPALFFEVSLSLIFLLFSGSKHFLFSVELEKSTANARGFSILKDIQVVESTISITLDSIAPYNIFKVGSPPRLVMELTNTENDWKKKQEKFSDHPILVRVRSGQFQNEPVKIARIVMELKSEADFQTLNDGNHIHVILHKKEIGNQTKTSIPVEQPELAPIPAETPKVPVTSKESIFDAADPTSLFGRQPVTLDFYDIEISELFKILGDKAGVNVVFGNQVGGTVSIQLKDVPFKDAVSTILSLKDLKMISLGKNILQVMSNSEFDQYKTKAISITRLFPINYAKATDVNIQLNSILTTLSGKGKTLVDDRTNSIIVTDTPEGIEMSAKLIRDLDKPTPQVMIEAKIVQVTLGKSLDLGIQWGLAYTDRQGNQMVTIGATKQSKADASNTSETPGSGAVGLMTRTPLTPSGGSDLEATGSGFTPAQGLGLAFGFVKDAVRLNAALSALAQKNKSKLLSNPKVATLNNQPATIKSEISEPYITTETQLTNAGTLTSQKVNQAKSGITLTVIPTINADGRITMKISPDITSSQPTAIGVPKTTSQQANTTVIVKDGETFVIGGLISELESDQKAYIPILGRIPLLGHLFKKTGTSKTRAELLVFVTPKIIPY